MSEMMFRCQSIHFRGFQKVYIGLGFLSCFQRTLRLTLKRALKSRFGSNRGCPEFAFPAAAIDTIHWACIGKCIVLFSFLFFLFHHFYFTHLGQIEKNDIAVFILLLSRQFGPRIFVLSPFKRPLSFAF